MLALGSTLHRSFAVPPLDRPHPAVRRDLGQSTRGLKVLHVLPLFRMDRGGPVRAVIDLSEALAARGHEVDVAACDYADCPPAWLDRAPEDHGPRLIPYTPGSLPGPLFTVRQLSRFERLLGRYDVVHFHNIWRASILQLAPAALAAGAAYVISARGMLDDWSMARRSLKKRCYLWLGGRRVLERAGWVHCTAELEKAQVERRIGRGRAVVIPNLMDLAPYVDPPPPDLARRSLGIPDDGDPLLLFLSRIDEKKGVDILIHAAAKLARRGLRFRLVVAGTGEPGYVERMRALVHATGLTDRVLFTGLVLGDVKTSLIRAAAALVLPTHQENFGFVFFEALACGTPVLTSTRVDTAPELARSGGALLAEPDADRFADSAEALLADPALRLRMGAEGRRWTMRYLDPAPLAAAFEHLYRTAGDRVPRSFEPTPYLPV